MDKSGDMLYFSWAKQGKMDSKGEKLSVYYHAIYKFKKGEVVDFNKGEAIVVLTGEDKVSLPAAGNSGYEFYLTALDRLYNESEAVKFK